MIGGRARRIAVLAACAAALALPRPAAAQADSTRPHPRPAPARPDTVARPDTLARPDTAAADTARDTLPHFFPTVPADVPAGPMPRGARYVFTADSLVFSDGVTLSDLLAHIPGVFVAREGYFGAAEPVLYGGRGPAALEIYWDGVPYLPIGRDSVWLDPARIPLAPLERVEVIVLPGTLRVYLVSRRQRSTVASSEVNVATGQFSAAQYAGGFAKRWRSGADLELGADYRTLNGAAATTTTSFNTAALWLKGGYVPNGHLGAEYQLVTTSFDRGGEPGLVSPWKAQRSTGLFRAFLATRTDGLGLRFEAAFQGATASRDTAVADRSVWEDRLSLSQTWTRASAGIAVTFSDPVRPWRADASAAWSPVPFFTLQGDARAGGYSHGRHGREAHLAAGLTLPLGFSARAEAAWSRDVQAPALAADTAITTLDLSGAVRWDSRFATVELGGVERDPFAPVGFAAGVDQVTTLSPVPRSTYGTVYASIRPAAGLAVSGWLFEPATGGADFEPPHHARVAATFDSKFWRTFRSGAFRLRAEFAVESWSRSLLGGVNGTQHLAVYPATFTEFNLEMRIVGVTIFWIIRNQSIMHGGYVQGAAYPAAVQYYGVHWAFHN